MQSNLLSGVHKIISIILLLMMANSQAAGLPPLTHGLTALNHSPAAPPLRLQNMDDEFIDIKDMQGKVIVLNFWATWCPPCRREMGSLERLNLATADKDVVVLAVNIGEDVDTVFSFMGTIEPSPTFQILFDPDSYSLEQWQVRGLPTTFIIGPDGAVAYRAVGGREFDHPEIISTVNDLLTGSSK